MLVFVFFLLQSQNKHASAKPFLSCLKNCDSTMVNYVFDKVSSTFLQLQRRQPHPHATQVSPIVRSNKYLTSLKNKKSVRLFDQINLRVTKIIIKNSKKEFKKL